MLIRRLHMYGAHHLAAWIRIFAIDWMCQVSTCAKRVQFAYCCCRCVCLCIVYNKANKISTHNHCQKCIRMRFVRMRYCCCVQVNNISMVVCMFDTNVCVVAVHVLVLSVAVASFHSMSLAYRSVVVSLMPVVCFCLCAAIRSSDFKVCSVLLDLKMSKHNTKRLVHSKLSERAHT